MLTLLAYLILLFSLLFFLIFMTVYTLGLIYSSIKGAPYVPTRKKMIENILGGAKIQKNKFFVEMGSGDGRILRHAAKKYGVRGVGVDVNLVLVVWARFLAKLESLEDRVDFEVKNIFDTDLTRADYVYLFLMPDLIKKLAKKMEKDLRKGAIVIAHGFPVKGWGKKQFLVRRDNPFPTYYYRL